MTGRRPGPRHIALAAALLVSVAAIVLLASATGTGTDHEHSSRQQLDLRSSISVSTPTPQKPMRQVLTLGRSVQGRPITATVLGDPKAPRAVLVVGCIHGNETAGIAVADRLASIGAPSRSALWIVRDLNPDGVHAGTRQNAHHVDLNRNFPFAWHLIGSPGDQQYSGPRALSEPESRIARSLILRIRPRITIWFHQPLGVTDQSGGDIHIERRFAALSHLPLHRLTRYPGSATGWQDHRLPSTTAFVVELPPGRLAPRRAARIAQAVLTLARER
jgi:murein peptide amidase A